MIGIATTDALPTMATWGGYERIVGINPLSIAIRVRSRRPLVTDTSLGASVHGRSASTRRAALPSPPTGLSTSTATPTWRFGRGGERSDTADRRPQGRGSGLGPGHAPSSLLSGAAYGIELGSVEDGAEPGATATW